MRSFHMSGHFYSRHRNVVKRFQRYYGKSLPFGEKSFDSEHIGLLSIEQALADYAYLLEHLREVYNASNAPVITFGGRWVFAYLTSKIRLFPGVSKLRPAGQIQPAKPFHPPREAVSFGRNDSLSIMKKYIQGTFVDLENVTYPETIALRKMFGLRIVAKQFMCLTGKKFWRPLIYTVDEILHVCRQKFGICKSRLLNTWFAKKVISRHERSSSENMQNNINFLSKRGDHTLHDS